LVENGAKMNARAAYGEVHMKEDSIRPCSNPLAGSEIGKMTPLHVAAWKGGREVAEILVRKGAKVNARSGNGETPLQSSLRHGEGKLKELLEQHGAKRRTGCGSVLAVVVFSAITSLALVF
jgi:hypothetical protein